jgi:hypothetical protein
MIVEFRQRGDDIDVTFFGNMILHGLSEDEYEEVRQWFEVRNLRCFGNHDGVVATIGDPVFQVEAKLKWG